MKLKQLESELSSIPGFRNPKIELEQYPTTAHLASHMLYTAATQYDDIESKTVVDLGIGCAVLTCASCLLGSEYNIGIDVDMDALDQAKENTGNFDVQVDLLHANLIDLTPRLKADTVIMNPPFGTKNKGIDMLFLEKASKISQHAIYSLHKTSTREHVLRKGGEFGFTGQVVAELRYNLDASYKFHKKKSVDILVDFIRFEKQS